VYPAVHLFRTGDAGDTLRVPPDGELLAVLQWNEPFGGAGRDFDLLLARPSNGDDVVLAASTNVQDGGGNPYEALRYVNDTRSPIDAYLAIAEFQSTTSTDGTRFDLNVFTRSALGLEYVVSRGQHLRPRSRGRGAVGRRGLGGRPWQHRGLQLARAGHALLPAT
jgi:hypothetical protein